MNGKSRCKILKDIRKQIAQSNDIAFVTSECKYQGDCKGTCPKCESEVRYLEQELEKRRKKGLAITLTGLATAATLTASGCFRPVEPELEGVLEETKPIETESEEATGEMGAIIDTEELDGEIIEWETEMGEIEPPVFMGDLVVFYPEICNLPGMTAEEQLDYVAGTSASDLRLYWQNDWVETRNGNMDVYDFEVDGKRYLAHITFDEGDVITHVSLLPVAEETETGTVTEKAEATGA